LKIFKLKQTSSFRCFLKKIQTTNNGFHERIGQQRTGGLG
jgi:hypothetical protein